MSEATGYFVRKATGLVRAWSAFDAFIYAFFSVNFVTLGMYIMSFGPFVPQGHLLPAAIITGIFVTFLVVVYGGLIATIPPGGGDYVLHSRLPGGAVREDPEVLLLGRDRRPGYRPPAVADRHAGAVPAGVQPRGGAPLRRLGGRLYADHRGIAQVRVHAASLHSHAVGPQHSAHPHGGLLPAVAQLGRHLVRGGTRRQ